MVSLVFVTMMPAATQRTCRKSAAAWLKNSEASDIIIKMYTEILALRYLHTLGRFSPRTYMRTPESPTSGVYVGMMKENAVATMNATSQSASLMLTFWQNIHRHRTLPSRWKMLPWVKWNVRCVHHGDGTDMPHRSASKRNTAMGMSMATNNILFLVINYDLFFADTHS